MNVNIVITDGFALNPGDLSWDRIRSLGSVDYFDRTASDLVAERCRDAHIIVTNKTPINAETIKSCKNLKAIAVTATGFNVVDVAAASAQGIIVCNVPIYGTDSVAQHVFALLLELTNHVGKNSASVSEGQWATAKDWCYSKAPIMELAGKTLGIVGFGRIGKKVAEIGTAFGMNIVYNDTFTPVVDSRYVVLPRLFEVSDVVSLHCPLTKENDAFIDRNLLCSMKKTALLINTSRGQLINEEDLAWALSNNVIRGAALDVLRQEPPPQGNPLIGRPNCLVTPHNAWLSYEARFRIMETTFDNISAALAGKPINAVTA